MLVARRRARSGYPPTTYLTARSGPDRTVLTTPLARFVSRDPHLPVTSGAHTAYSVFGTACHAPYQPLASLALRRYCFGTSPTAIHWEEHIAQRDCTRTHWRAARLQHACSGWTSPRLGATARERHPVPDGRRAAGSAAKLRSRRLRGHHGRPTAAELGRLVRRRTVPAGDHADRRACHYPRSRQQTWSCNTVATMRAATRLGTATQPAGNERRARGSEARPGWACLYWRPQPLAATERGEAIPPP